MPRRLRVEFPGAIYHVMSRGDRREEIFRDDRDRERFLETTAEACGKTGWQVHAYCLMRNHFHLVVETPQPNLVAGMKWLLGTYTIRFNRRHGVIGHLFAGRFKSLLVLGRGGYLRTVCDYVHLNSARAGLVRASEPLRTFRWSSLREYLKPPSQRAAWVRVDRMLGECGIPKDSVAGRREFERKVEARRGREDGGALERLRRGWCYGDEEFRSDLLERVSGKAGPQHYGAEVAESAETKAERIVAHELQKRRWREAHLARRRKGDPDKVTVAVRLRMETTMTLEWIAARLKMGTKTYLSHLLYWRRRRSEAKAHDTKD